MKRPEIHENNSHEYIPDSVIRVLKFFGYHYYQLKLHIQLQSFLKFISYI